MNKQIKKKKKKSRYAENLNQPHHQTWLVLTDFSLGTGFFGG